MVTNDATILKIKHDLLREVAKLAWEGTLEEQRDELPYKMFPGPQAQFRRLQGGEEDDHLLLSGICQYDQAAFSDTFRQYVYHSISYVRGIPYVKGTRS